MNERFPPLYQCSDCKKPVAVTPRAGQEPIINRPCAGCTAPVWANRKVTLRGRGVLESMPPIQRHAIKITLTIRQLLSALTGRSI